jgi:hypothetical protein
MGSQHQPLTRIQVNDFIKALLAKSTINDRELAACQVTSVTLETLSHDHRHGLLTNIRTV